MTRKVTLFSIIIVILIMIMYSRRVDFNNLSEEQLAERGYYAYVLPKDLQTDLGWTRVIRMRSFDFHCWKSMDSRNDRWNYIRIGYYDPEGSRGFEIYISPTDAIFDKNAAELLSLAYPSLESTPSRNYMVYKGSIEFIDALDLDVVIYSSLPIEEMVSLADKLIPTNRIGEVNPFEENCE
jgi:hypothetical protein